MDRNSNSSVHSNIAPQTFPIKNYTLTYSGVCSPEQSENINKCITSFTSPFVRKIEMFRAYYIKATDTVKCYITTHFNPMDYPDCADSYFE